MNDSNDSIITVITHDFSELQQAIKGSGKGEIVGSALLNLADTLQRYARTCGSIESQLRQMNESGKSAVFFPFVTEGQLLTEIQALPHTIIVLNGLDPATKAFKDLEMNAWHRYEKVIVAENIRGMVESFPEQFLDMYRTSHPRNPNLPSVQERITTDPEDRYAKFVELVNQRLTMKELAVALGLSVPATYLIRTQYKQRLLDDENVLQSAPAMKFHKK
jgi:hypothetical protein